MRLRKLITPVFGALLLSTACANDSNGAPISEPLIHSIDFGQEGYRNYVSKIAPGDNLELLDVKEARAVVQFNQDGLKIAMTGPEKYSVKLTLTYVDNDDLLNLGIFGKQPFSEPIIVDREVVEKEVSFDELVALVNTKRLEKDVDIREMLDDGSIDVEFEITLLTKPIVAVSDTVTHSVRAGYFNGDFVYPFATSFEEPRATSDSMQTSETSEDCGFDINGDYSCSTSTDYFDHGYFEVEVIGGEQNVERIPGNYKKWFDGNQKIAVTGVDERDESSIEFNGILDIETEEAEFSVRVFNVHDDETAFINVPTWAGKVLDAHLVGRGSVYEEGGFFENDTSEYFDVEVSLGH